jgi:NADPH:quinone reductase-like Zn-dependent oxidoreductase
LQLDEIEQRQPGKDEVLLNVKATGLTGDQLTFIKGFFHPGEPVPPLPATFGYEAAGVVAQVGPDVDPAWVGQTATPVGPYDFVKYGSVGEQIVVPADRLVKIPQQLSFAGAASLWIPYLTAYPLVEHGRSLAKGSYVLIMAATSTVGHAAIQFAQALGLKPIGITRSEEKAAKLREITGLADIIVTKKEKLTDKVMQITDGKGVSLVLDPIGGSGVTDLANVAAPGGVIVEYGVIGGMNAPLPVPQLIGKGLTIQGFSVNQISDNPQRRQAAVDFILQQIEQGKVKPLVAAEYALADYQAAFKQLIKNDKLGRAVLTTDK